MKVLFLNVTGALGGAERLLLDLLASLRQTSPAVELHLVLGQHGPLAEQAACLGVEISVLPLPDRLREMGDSGLGNKGGWRVGVALARRALAGSWGAWRYVGRLRRMVERIQPTIIHSNSLKFHLLSSLARLPVPVVWHLHDFLGSRVLMAQALRWGRCAGAVAVSQAVAQDAQTVLLGVPTAIVPNAIDTDRFRPGLGEVCLDQLAGLAPLPGEVRVGLVATYARWKGQDVFLEAAEQVVRELPDRPLRFFIVGGPIYQTQGSQWSVDELRCLAAGLLAQERVGFIGFQSDLPPIYRALDVVVHASTRPEPFGLTIIEAMASGKPVIVSHAGGAAELFTHDHDAVGVPPGDPRPLAQAIRRLVSDEQERLRLGKNARRTAVERYSMPRLGTDVLAAYRRFGLSTPHSVTTP